MTCAGCQQDIRGHPGFAGGSRPVDEDSSAGGNPDLRADDVKELIDLPLSTRQPRLQPFGHLMHMQMQEVHSRERSWPAGAETGRTQHCAPQQYTRHHVRYLRGGRKMTGAVQNDH